jgi:hypothetical protein
MQLVITPSGLVKSIYDETLPLAELGLLTIQRASQVEPDSSGRWWADLQLVNGPVLGPFIKRSVALAAEVAWLETHWLEANC